MVYWRQNNKSDAHLYGDVYSGFPHIRSFLDNGKSLVLYQSSERYINYKIRCLFSKIAASDVWRGWILYGIITCFYRNTGPKM